MRLQPDDSALAEDGEGTQFEKSKRRYDACNPHPTEACRYLLLSHARTKLKELIDALH